MEEQLNYISTLLRPIIAEIKAQDNAVKSSTMAKVRKVIAVIDEVLVSGSSDYQKKQIMEWKFLLESFQEE